MVRRVPVAAALARRLATSSLALAVGLAAVTWPVDTLARPRSHFMDSWPTALHLATEQHLYWGSDIDFTYGPLGFLRFALLYFTGPTRLALLYTAFTQIALGFSLIYVLRRAYGVLVAAGLTFVALWLVPDERGAAAVFIWAVVALRDDAPAVVRKVFPVAVGCLAALEMLVKFNGGVVILAIGMIVALAVRGSRARNLALLAGSFGVSFIALWLLAGQRIGDVPSYLTGTREIVAGYTAALGWGDHDDAWNVATAALTIAIGFVVARGTIMTGAGRVRWAVYPLWAVAGFFFWREGFVRSDLAHRQIFFGFALCALLGFAWDRRDRERILLATAVVVVALFANLHPAELFQPGKRLTAAVDQLRTMTDPGRRARIVRDYRTALRHKYRLDGRTVRQLRGRSVTVMPWDEFAAVFAYRLRWRPLRTIVPSSTYTRSLDRRTVRMLKSRGGPERILRSTKQTIDRVNTVWDMPAVMRTILCRYEQLNATSRWQVLGRARDRCGAPRTVAIVTGHWGQTIPVPLAHSGAAMFVRIRGVEPRGLEQIESLVFRAAQRHIVLDGHRQFHLVPATAADGLVLSVPPAVDYSQPFSFSQHVRQLSVTRGYGRQGRSGRVTYEFEEIPIRPFQRYPGSAGASVLP